MYDFKEVEAKWQKIWAEKEAFKAIDFSAKPKYYVLSEFFGPSGRGIHLGHVKCYTPSEVIARYKRLKGFNVLYPVGWDAFGLPTENSAIKDKRRPEEVTATNVKIFTNQLRRMGYSFDWSREINTTDKDYYKWTQWIFLKLFEHGMAYKSQGVVNYCPSCQTVLSNEDSQDGICDRCKNEVVQEKRDVWFLRMKDYSEKMLEAIERIDMRENLKIAQRHWIGRSEGAEIDFAISGGKDKLKVFTTRPDTLYGVTFMAIAPEHELIAKNKDRITNYKEVSAYKEAAAGKSAIERSAAKDKTGVRIEGLNAVNPVTGKEIPIFAADYVMTGYGTGAIMAVPAHDERDYAFAVKFGLPIIEVISGGDISKEAYAGDGTLINSGIIDGLNVQEAKRKITGYLEQKGIGQLKVNYKMQDWPFNRQRYWGEPFPIVLCDKCGCVPIKDKELPLTLPPLEDYTPDKAGNSPLSKAKDFVNCKCPKCGAEAKRETDTMPNWAGSSWYWLRFLDPHNKKAFVDKDKLKYWGAVDLYTGGVEHVTRHMLYASFWHNFLYDIGEVPHKDPFAKRMCNGLILDDKGQKMGKSSGNAIDPIELIEAYGADAFRLHILFVGDYEKNTVWTTDGINGCTRFIQNVYSFADIMRDDETVSKAHEVALNKLIKFYETSINEFGFNTIIAEMMKFTAFIKDSGYITKEELRQFLIMLNPFAPHITSEMYQQIFKGDINGEAFPAYDESKLIEKTFEIPVQHQGRLKGTLVITLDEPQEQVAARAMALLGVTEVKKVIYVPNKIINLIF